MNDADREEQLGEIIAEFLKATQRGVPPDRQELTAAHPELAGDLRSFFANHDQMQADAGGADSPTRSIPALESTPPQQPMTDPALLAPTIFQAATSARADRPRETIGYFGDYELLEEIARGGMGVVYKARQVNLDRTVALKMILSGQLASEDDVRRFYQEAESAANLEHAGIVPIYEIGQHQGQHFFSMAFVDGPSLAGMLADGPLPPREAAEVMQQVAEAIAYAHSRGVIHRDLKPANVLLARHDDSAPSGSKSAIAISPTAEHPGRAGLYEPKVTDFGLAKRVAGDSSLTATGQILGTPSYMPPEQAAGREVKETADVYSLGAVLYALLTGHAPFQADNPLDTLTQVLEYDPVSPRLVNPAVPRDLETICLKCLQKWPDERYASAAAVAEDLGRFLSDEPILARPAGAAERLARWLRKRRRSVALTTAACAGTVLIVAAGIFGWQTYQRSQQGHVNFRTTEPLATAEIFGRGGEVLQKFAIPNEQPHPFPEGNYRVRLSAPGLLSETAQMWVKRGAEHEFQINLTGRQLWEPIRLGPQDRFEVADLDGRADIILTQENFGEVTLRRLDGRTTAAVWSLPLDGDSPPEELASEPDREFWRDLMQHWSQDDRPGHEPRGVMIDVPVSQQGNQSDPPDLLQPCPDLNADGTGDLVWMLHHRPALVAMSGRDGRALWWHHSEPPQSGRPGSNRIAAQLESRPLLWDVDADGRSDFVATFRHPWGALWVEAISGASGTPLWKYNVDGESIDPLAQRAFELLDVGNAKVVALAIGRRLIGLDVATGKPAWPPHDLGPPVRSQVRFADFNGDGSHDVLVPDLVGDVTRREGGRTYRTDSGAETSSIRVVSLPGFETVWSTGGSLRESEAESWPLVADLDNDGPPEVAVSLGTLYERLNIEVLDGRTGERRWERRLYGEMAAIAALRAGPDFDADGYNELILVTTALLHDEHESYVFVDALSGRDGRTVAWWKHAILPMRASADFYSIGEPSWWQSGADGWPQLVVPWSSGRQLGQPGQGCALVALAQSATAHLLHDVSDPRPADFNGDSIADLYYIHQTRGGTLLTALAGGPPESWRRLGRWTPGPDCDGDRVPDLVQQQPPSETLLTSYRTLDAVSSRDGRVLTSFEFPWESVRYSLSFHAPTLPNGDLDRDGHADLLMWSWLEDRWQREDLDLDLPFPLAALSSRTGRQLWSADDWRLPDEPKYRPQRTGSSGWTIPNERNVLPFAARCQDLDADGITEVLCFCFLGGNDRGRRAVACISGRDGSLMWTSWLDAQQPHTSGYNSVAQVVRVAFADLNADQTQDVVLALAGQPSNYSECQVHALSGRDGAPLWSHTLGMTPGFDNFAEELPDPLVDDLDGDGKPEIIFPDSESAVDYGERGSNGPMNFQVVALNGTDGRPKWQWSGKADSFRPRSSAAGNPVLADFNGDGRQAVCLGIQPGDTPEIVVLDHGGEVRHRFAGPMELYSHDVNGDGRDELLFSHEQKVQAVRDDGSALWAWPVPEGHDGTIREIHGGVPMVVVALGRDIYGLDGRTGRSMWRGPNSGDDTSVLWPSGNDRRSQPRLVASDRETIGQRTLATDGGGSYLAIRGTPVSSPPPPDPRLLRELPWATFDPVSDASEMLLFLTAFLLLAAPVAALAWLVWRRRWTLRVFLAFPVAVLLWIGLLQLFLSLPGAPKPGLRSTDQAALQMLSMTLLGGTLLVFPGLLTYCLYRRRWRLAGGLVGLSLVVSAVYAGLVLWRRSRWMDPLEQFTWEGWHTILYVGAWLTGLLIATSLVGWFIIRAGVRFVRWRWARRARPA